MNPESSDSQGRGTGIWSPRHILMTPLNDGDEVGGTITLTDKPRKRAYRRFARFRCWLKGGHDWTGFCRVSMATGGEFWTGCQRCPATKDHRPLVKVGEGWRTT